MSVNPAKYPNGRIVYSLPEVAAHLKGCFQLESSPPAAESARAEVLDDNETADESNESEARTHIEEERASNSTDSSSEAEGAESVDGESESCIETPSEDEPESASAAVDSTPQVDELGHSFPSHSVQYNKLNEALSNDLYCMRLLLKIS